MPKGKKDVLGKIFKTLITINWVVVYMSLSVFFIVIYPIFVEKNSRFTKIHSSLKTNSYCPQNHSPRLVTLDWAGFVHPQTAWDQTLWLNEPDFHIYVIFGYFFHSKPKDISNVGNLSTFII